jgi:hypothetical protein
MAYENNNVSLEQMLLSFMAEQDPIRTMLEWLCDQMRACPLGYGSRSGVKDRCTKIRANKPAGRLPIRISGPAILHTNGDDVFAGTKTSKRRVYPFLHYLEIKSGNSTDQRDSGNVYQRRLDTEDQTSG